MTRIDSTEMQKIFCFTNPDGKGIRDIWSGKGHFFSTTYTVLMIVLMFIIFVSVRGLKQSDNMAFLLVAIFAGAFFSYIYFKALIEIAVETDTIKLRAYKFYTAIPDQEIKGITIKNFSTWGIIYFNFKTYKGTQVYFLWAPSFERERYELLLQLVTFLKSRKVFGQSLKTNISTPS